MFYCTGSMVRFLSLVLHEREKLSQSHLCRLLGNSLLTGSSCTHTHTQQEGQSHILCASNAWGGEEHIMWAGDSVEEGTNIVTLEAMKMQNPLFAPMTSKVRWLSLHYTDMYVAQSTSSWQRRTYTCTHTNQIRMPFMDCILCTR